MGAVGSTTKQKSINETLNEVQTSVMQEVSQSATSTVIQSNEFNFNGSHDCKLSVKGFKQTNVASVNIWRAHTGHESFGRV